MSAKMISKPLFIGAAATLAAAALGGYVWKEEHRVPVLDIYIFSLKSGRSVFIRTPEDRRILIDGGGNNDIIRELTKILPFYSRRIDTIISTDTDGKNASGLIDVMERYAVDRAFIPAITLDSLGLASSSDPVHSTFIDTLYLKKIAVHKVAAGDSIIFDSRVNASVLFPATTTSFAYSKASAPQLLLKVSYGSTSVMLLADATKKVQRFIASSTSGTSDSLYVSQSASPSDMSGELMSTVQPAFLIYSKSISKTSSVPIKKSSKSASISKKKAIGKQPNDPFAQIPLEDRLNLKEKGTIHLVSDGVKLVIE
jgi:competence protein ComEC